LNDNQQQSVPRLWSVETLAEQWALKPATIRKWARVGKLPGVRVNGLWRFDERDLLQFLDKQDNGVRP